MLLISALERLRQDCRFWASLSPNITNIDGTTTPMMTYNPRWLVQVGRALKAVRRQDFVSEGGLHWEMEPAIS